MGGDIWPWKYLNLYCPVVTSFPNTKISHILHDSSLIASLNFSVRLLFSTRLFDDHVDMVTYVACLVGSFVWHYLYCIFNN